MNVDSPTPKKHPIQSGDNTGISEKIQGEYAGKSIKKENTDSLPSVRQESVEEAAEGLELADRLVTSSDQAEAVSFVQHPLVYGNIQLKPITREQAEEFWKAVNESNSKEGLTRALIKQYQSAGATDEQIEAIRGIANSLAQGLYDGNFMDESGVPLLHTQIRIDTPQGEVGLCANRISYGGEKYGVAMAGKVAANLEHVLPLIWNENLNVMVDLLSQQEQQSGGKVYEEAQTATVWEALPKGVPKSYGDFTITKTEEEPVTVKAENDTLRQVFVLQNNRSGEQKRLARFHYKHWPDREMPDRSAMSSLYNIVQEIDEAETEGGEGLEEFLPGVNCGAGIGRTGVFFAGLRLFDVTMSNTFKASDYKQAVLHVLLEGKNQRNSRFVQSAAQTLGLYNLFVPNEEQLLTTKR